MTATQRIAIIINNIFGKELDAATLRRFMMAFASDVDNFSSNPDEQAEQIAEHWIAETRAEIIQQITSHESSQAARFAVTQKKAEIEAELNQVLA